MAPPSSLAPTSLLWAHQLKREHGFLLQRMQNLEAQNENQEARIQTAESASKVDSNSEVAELAEKVNALDGAGIEKRIADMERGVTEKLEDVQAESEAHTLQIASLQKDGNMAEEERRKAMSKDKALLKRIGEVEEGLQKYEKSLDRMGKRLDETRFEQIKGQLDGLTKQVQREGEQMKWLTESINALEAANAELTKANQKLEAELSKMAAKAASAERKKNEKASSAATADVEAGAEQDSQKKKSHKWAGGGADRDIIRMGSDLFGSPHSTQRSPYSATNELPKKKSAPPGPKKKSQPPPLKQERTKPHDSSETPKKSHRWAGGGADKAIIQAGISQSAGAKRRRSSETFSETAKKKPQKWAGGGADRDDIQAGSSPASKSQQSHRKEIVVDKPKPKPKQSARVPTADGNEVVVRAGKGWIEVADTESGELNVPSAPTVKRKRGRPRKEHITPQLTDEELSQGRITRRGIQQTTQQPPASTDNKSVVNEVLGDLQYVPMAQEILRVNSSIPRHKLEQLKKIFEEDPRSQTDFEILTEKSEARRQLASKKRTADSAFGVPSQDDADSEQRFKNVKREDSPGSVINSSAASPPAANTEAQTSERNESTGIVFGLISSQKADQAPPKAKREIIQLDD